MSDESLFREVDEEVRQEQYKKLWDKFGNYFVALCVVIVAAVAGVKGYQYFQIKQSEAAAIVYFDGVKMASDGKFDDALKALAAVGHPGFKQLGLMQQASVLAEQGKTKEAVAAFDALAADATVDASLRDLARIRAGYLLADSLKPDELISRLGSFDREGQVWRHAAREIFGLAAYRTADYSMADRYMNANFADPDTPQAMRQRAQVMIQLLTPLLQK
ncbi:MAG TPA: tetratricopeptide repeat protein [Aestuariivirga sp.]